MSGRFAYGACMILAVLVFLLGRRLFAVNDPSARLPLMDRIWIGISAFFGGTISAKLPFVLMNDPAMYSWETWFSDGKTLTTGLMGAYLGVEICKAIRGIRVKTGDGLALPLALALTIGRLGCFANGCCAGKPTELPWGYDFGDGIPRHPTQLYESVFHGFWVWILARWQISNQFATQRLKIYLIAYCVFRFVMEFIRIEPRMDSGLTFYQWVVMVFASFLLLQAWYDERAKRAK
ncbi:prolipoprotein diacylglyceryl transferase [Telmatocola sphagniphila]|jgi:prolipoprotein diacylglyceryltransferase|uniref:Prolipoprotein diacylglyceryl transferase n=1 Tax=Telmatocola sphagniphila TaxID=1123043 RepID=A0A8E6BAZ4_9BACT|nr:prolipoprotein diacylglyceryl transferase family protein [Telmatocola sphagniphila]QVL33828.1 prolipoprotein diacylglyceryl transferase [Telmatocola sphagniphila]